MSFGSFNTSRLGQMIQRLPAMIASELLPGEFSYLFSPFRHQPLLSFRRATMIINRVRLIAFLFAVLTPLWVIVDYIFFPASLWLYLCGLRILTSASFFALVYLYKPSGSILDAYRSLGILSLIPATFYLASQIAISSFQLEGMPGTLATGYTFLPFVFLCCLSIFPLTVLESVAIASPILLSHGLTGILSWSYGVQFWSSSFVGELWLLIILTGVSTLASISHLSLMLALVRQASHDPLTQAFTRRSGEELLDLQFSISVRNGTPLSLAFIDLDHFKAVNDKFGHEIGDLVLKKAAAAISQLMRAGDILTRWGGEEFVIIMPCTDIHQAKTAMDRLHQNGLGRLQDGEIITPSIGISERVRDAATDRHRLTEIADGRMYLAKKRGRNLVVTDDAEISTVKQDYNRA